MNAVEALQVGDEFRITDELRNKGRGVFFSSNARWKKISDIRVEAIGLGKNAVSDFATGPIYRPVSDFDGCTVVLLSGAPESVIALSKTNLASFDLRRAQLGEGIVCWVPDRFDKNSGTFQPVWFVGVARNGWIAIQYPGSDAIHPCDPQLIRMAPLKVLSTPKEEQA